MKTQAVVGTLVAVLSFSPALGVPAEAQGVGEIGGSVLDASGLVLPGVTVTLSSAGVIGGNQETITDARGTYQFTRLVPGTYTVTATLAGFRTTVQEGIVVNADVTARADLALEIGAVEETVIVTGEVPLLDTTRTLRQTVITRDTLNVLPSRQDVWAIARTVPAVIMNKYDVGGSEMFAQSTSTSYGSTNQERTYTMDGMDIQWAGGEGFVISYLDAHMFQEVNLQTASGAAETSKGGPITNMITRTGTNQFGGEYSFTGGGSGTAFTNLPLGLRDDLQARVPAVALALNPDLDPSAEMLGIYDNSWTVGGPILPDKLWYTATTSYVTLEQHRLGSYNTDGTRALDKNRMRNGSLKLSWAMRQNHQLSYLFNFNEKSQFFRTENTGTGFISNEATSRQRITSTIHQMKYTSVLSSRVLVDVSGSLLAGRERSRPQGNVEEGTLPTFDVITNVHGGAVPSYLTRPADRRNFLASVSYTSGAHDIKTGYQLMWRKAGDTHSSLISPYFPFGIRAVFRDGVPDSVNTYNTPTQFEYFSQDHAWYIQDRWTPIRKLTLNLGLRLETTYAKMAEHCQQETLFIGAQCFDAQDGQPDLFVPSPRFGLIYDLTGSGKTAIKASLNRYNQPIGVTFFSVALNPVRRVNDTRAWDDANNDLFPQLSELGPSTGYALGTSNRYADDVKWPHSTEMSIGIEHNLPGNLVVAATYVHRTRGDEVGPRNLAVPTDSYTAMDVTEAATGRQVTVYNQDPALRGQFDNFWDNHPELDAEFNGLDLVVNKRLSNGWMLMGGASFGRSHGDIYSNGTYGGADLNDPNFLFRRGVVGNDVPVSFKMAGLFELPYDFRISGSVQHFSGFPEITTLRVGPDTVALTQVAQTITVEPRGTVRLPVVNMVDISVRRAFRSGRYAIEPVFDIFNLLNGSAIRSRNTTLGSAYGAVSDIQRGRLIKAGLNVTF